MAEKSKPTGVSMNLQDIQKLITMLEKSNLQELELETGGTKIRLAKIVHHAPVAPPAPPQFLMVPQGAQAAPTAAPLLVPPSSAPAAAPEASGEGTPAAVHQVRPATAVEVKSPMVGTFYRAPAPGAEPFVKIGDRVRKGQTLCIIEAMKLMNEIECEVDGVVIDISTENAQPVEYGEVLMHIDPAG
jgi:acetyl-CoA carboxylase biotin carboxyl carrier protein